MERDKKYDNCVTGIFILLAIIFGLIISSNLDKEEKILANSELRTKAKIDYIFSSRSTKMVVYRYTFQGKSYEGTDVCPKNLIACWKTQECYGDSIVIKFSPTDPDISRVFK